MPRIRLVSSRHSLFTASKTMKMRALSMSRASNASHPATSVGRTSDPPFGTSLNRSCLEIEDPDAAFAGGDRTRPVPSLCEQDSLSIFGPDRVEADVDLRTVRRRIPSAGRDQPESQILVSSPAATCKRYTFAVRRPLGIAWDHAAGKHQIAGSVHSAFVEFSTGVFEIGKPLAVGGTVNLVAGEAGQKRNPLPRLAVIAHGLRRGDHPAT